MTKSPAIALTMPQANTRVGNGSALLTGVDGRSAGARRYREVVARLHAELKLQKNARITEQDMALLRRAAALMIWCESAEADMANGVAFDIGNFTAATTTLRRTLIDIGLT